MPKASIKLTLYHAHWCGHCVKFLPTWNKLMRETSSPMNNVDVKIETLEESKLKRGGATINGKEISGYPTIKLTLTMDKATKEYEYTGKREDIAKYLQVLTGKISKNHKKN